jgi:hypothetical protein
VTKVLEGPDSAGSSGSIKAENFMTTRVNINFSRKTLHNGIELAG